jgi:hypothetical protein
MVKCSITSGAGSWRELRSAGGRQRASQMSDLATDPDDPALRGNTIGGDPQTYRPVL